MLEMNMMCEVVLHLLCAEHWAGAEPGEPCPVVAIRSF